MCTAILRRCYVVLVALALLFLSASCFNVNKKPTAKAVDLPRLLTRTIASIAVASSLFSPRVSSAADNSGVPIYFGVGCFWHVQHEFVSTEKSKLGRSDTDITSFAGYAGGLGMDKDGLVCYHNLRGVADYDRLGHTEVVGMTVPSKSVGEFASEYFSLFGSDSERPDKGDTGAQYRSVIGLPGGVDSQLFPVIQEALEKSGKNLKLVPGKGNDPDTLYKKMVWVMDSNTFPAKQAELYHQFHDGFMFGEQYGDAYHAIRNVALENGHLSRSGCPDL